MQKQYFIALFTLLLFSGFGYGQKAVYNFCVSSPSVKTFKAQVAFSSIDFGETAARQMVFNEVNKALGSEAKITRYNSTCSCHKSCPILEVTCNDWDGNMGENDMSTASILGSLAEIADKFVSESKAIFTDPGDFLKRNFFSSSEN